MPRMDGTGPKGEGPMTGWGRGKCIMPLEETRLRGLSGGLLSLESQRCRGHKWGHRLKHKASTEEAKQ